MLALFFISMTCFFLLFTVLLALLRQAKASGARAASISAWRSTGGRSTRVDHASAREGRPGPLPDGLDRSLSSLVPGKQPDWGFMVRDGGRAKGSGATLPGWRPGRKAPVSAPEPQKVRPDWAYYNADSGDLSDPYQPVTPVQARRA